MQLHELVSNQANEYSPALLMVTWEEESLEEVNERVRTALLKERIEADQA